MNKNNEKAVTKFRNQYEAYMQGYIEGIKAYAVWSNGEQLVGVMRKHFPEVVDQICAGKDEYFNQIWAYYPFINCSSE